MSDVNDAGDPAVSGDLVYEQARLISGTGKMIQDRVFKAISRKGTAGPDGSVGEELSITQFHAIKKTVQYKSLTISRLAEMLDVSPPSASALVDRLVDKGFLIRKRHPNDRRKVVISVNPDAVPILIRVENQVIDSFVDLLHRIGPEISAQWCEAMVRVRECMEAELREEMAQADDTGEKTDNGETNKPTGKAG